MNKVQVDSSAYLQTTIPYAFEYPPNIPFRDDLFSYEFTAIEEAISKNDIKRCSYFAKWIRDINARMSFPDFDEFNYTLLSKAVAEGRVEVVILLLQHNASPDREYNPGKTPRKLAEKLKQSTHYSSFKYTKYSAIVDLFSTIPKPMKNQQTHWMTSTFKKIDDIKLLHNEL